MCGLFGFVHYGEAQFKNLQALTNSLAEYSAIRGTDATGIAFVKNGIQIQKEARSAYSMNFKHPDSITSLIGHTRHATHGSEKLNYNNHPFFGKAGNTRFALAHNGVLWNDRSLLNLPKTKIETDSYMAVQIIEKQKKLSFESIWEMSETVRGSFSFSILDDKNNLYLVKGDSQLSLLHFQDKKIYVYASTDEILYKALVDSFLFEDIKKHRYEDISIDEGTIHKISPYGKIEAQRFRYFEHYRPRWWEFGILSDSGIVREPDKEYMDILRSTAQYNGFDVEQIEELWEAGFTSEEIEEAIYEV